MYETKEEIKQALELLIQKAEQKKLWLFCNYQSLWFSPAELRAANVDGRFLWSPMNWELRDPIDRINYLTSQIDDLANQRTDIRKRMMKG